MYYIIAKGRYGEQVYTVKTEKSARKAAETLARTGADTVMVQHTNTTIAVYKKRD